MTLLADRPDAQVAESELVVGRRIQEFSQLAGPISPTVPGEDYQVAYRGVDAVHGRARVARSLAVAGLNLAFEALFFLWLLYPTHRPPVSGPALAQYANWFVIGSIGLMELLRLINVLSLSLASIIARDPVPVAPQRDQRIAFLTTIVPSKEPIDVVRGTLQAALRIRYRGILDVWILDEGDDPAVKAMCRELGVNHFTRRDVARYNTRKGAFRAKTKHGNYNAWVAEHGESYEILLSVDPDHVPLPNYAERILGYFRDPDVAFVVGPQCYANDETFVTRAAESQQFPFHSLIQRAANRYNAAMLVGTNNAIRISALRHVGGLSDSVTEDLATGMKFHSRRNPRSGRRWKSVYTPDVLAVGEGPSSWGDFFSQQLRWSRGTFEVLLTEFWRRLPRLSPGRGFHYGLIMTFYPSMAIGWILGAINACLFLALGVQGIVVPVTLWLALYVDATAFQLWVYLRNRRYNVSPYEPEGSSGVKGMLMSIFASPIFASSMVATILRLPARFVVTPKGLSTSADHILTFRRHLQWAVILVAAIVASVFLGFATPAVLLWPSVALVACLTPPVLWIVERVVGRRPALVAEPVGAEGKVGATTESLNRAALDAMIKSGTTPPSRSPLSVPFPAVGVPTRAHLPRTPDPRTPDPRTPDPRTPDPRSPDVRPSDARPPGPRVGEAAPTEVSPSAAAGAAAAGAAAGAATAGPRPRPTGPPPPPVLVPPRLPKGWVHRDGPGGPGPHGARPGPRPPGPNGAGPNGAGPNGAGPNGAGPNGAGPNGAGPNGAGPRVTGPNGTGPNGTGPNGTGPNGVGRPGHVPRGGPAGPSSVPPGTMRPPAAGTGAPPPADVLRGRHALDDATAAPLPPTPPGERRTGGRRAAQEGSPESTDVLARVTSGPPVDGPDPAPGTPAAPAAPEEPDTGHASTVAVRVVALAAVARADAAPPADEPVAETT